MYKTRKRYLSLTLLVVILIISCLPKSALAFWEEDNNDWKYIGDNGYELGWKQIAGKWYYFTPETGIMKIGWFYDKQYSKWYYLNVSGDMDYSKTTSTYPVELQNISSKIKQYVNEEISYKWTNNVDGNIFVCFMSEGTLTPRQYYYHVSTGNVYEMRNGTLNNLATNEVIDYFTEDKANQVVKDYLSKNNKYIPGIIKVETDEGNSYLVHCYDDMGEYSTTSSWYYVDKTTREVKPML